MSSLTPAELAAFDQVSEEGIRRALGIAASLDHLGLVDAMCEMTFGLLEVDAEPGALATMVAGLALRMHRGTTRPDDGTAQDDPIDDPRPIEDVDPRGLL